MSPVWFHCNFCRRHSSQVQASLHLTNCGRVFCSDCGANLARRFCSACKGRCKRSIPLNSKAHREVKGLFENLGTKIKNINRAAAFHDRQTRSLFRFFYKNRAVFKETFLRYEDESKETRKRKNHLQTKLDALERREAFLEGRKEALLSQISKVEEEIFGNFFAPPAPARIYKERSSFQDSGVSQGLMSGDLTPRDIINKETKERKSPAMQLLFDVTAFNNNKHNNNNKNNNKYPFFSSLKKRV